MTHRASDPGTRTVVAPLLLMLADGRFPSGAHAHSAGVESAVSVGDVIDIGSLERYLHGRLATTGAVDAAFAATACVVAREDPARAESFAVLDRHYDARVPSPRSRAVDRRLGRQLLRTVRSVWPGDVVLDQVDHPEGPHQAMVWGVAAALAGAGPHDAALLVLHHLSVAVTTAAVRLLGLDPFAVVAIQAAAADHIEESATAAVEAAGRPMASLPAFGGAMSEILAEHHGSWTARLFVA